LTITEAVSALERLSVRPVIKDDGSLSLQGPKSSLAEAAALVKPVKPELLAHLHRLEDRHRSDLGKLVEVEPGVWTHTGCEQIAADIIAGNSVPVLVQEQPARPHGSPVYGLTLNGHLVTLPRQPAAELRDPTRSVTGEGWPQWYPRLAGDLVTVGSKPTFSKDKQTQNEAA